MKGYSVILFFASLIAAQSLCVNEINNFPEGAPSRHSQGQGAHRDKINNFPEGAPSRHSQGQGARRDKINNFPEGAPSRHSQGQGAHRDKYGTQKNPGLSCANISKKQYETLDNGVYWIRLKSGVEPFPVFCDMLAGGWTLVFKAVAGVPGVMSDSWKLPYEMYEYSLQALNKESHFRHHYKNRIVRHWISARPNQVRVVLYKQTTEEVVLRFNARNTNNLNWFSQNNLLEAPWADIKTKTKNFFSVDAACYSGYCRAFFINHAYNGCPNDIGWMTIGSANVCRWEKRLPMPSFLYSKVDKAVNWNEYSKVGSADVFAVYVR